MKAALSKSASTLESVGTLVRRVAAEEVMPRYLKVAHHRKSDGSLFTEADLAAQDRLSQLLPTIVPVPVIGEEMPLELQQQLLVSKLTRMKFFVVVDFDSTTD